MKSAHFVFFVFLFFVFLVPKVLAASAGDVVINEVAFKDSPDWIEFFVKTSSNYQGIRIYEGETVLLKEFPSIALTSGDYVVLHFNGDPLQDENNTLGKGANGYWDLYTADSGLTGTDDSARIQKTSTSSVSLANTIDAVIWSNNEGGFSGSKSIANSLVSVNHWGSADFNIDDSGAWIDSDGINPSQSIGRDAFSTDINSKTDWSKFGSSTMGSSNLIPTPTPTSLPTSTPTATSVPTATPTPTNIRQIDFSISSNVAIGQSFDTLISLSSFNADTLYYIKALIGKDLSSLTDGRTLGSDNVAWLAWNASWSKMPSIQTDNAGAAIVTISVKTDDDIEPGNYQMKIRVKEANGTESVDSGVKTISVSVPANSAVASATPVPTPKLTSSSSKSGTAKVQGSIKTIKQLSEGSAIETEGLVSVPFGVLGSNYFYLDDGEAGIMVKSEKKIDLKLGQRIKVASTIEESYGEKYIKTSDIAIINNSKNPPIPKLIKGNEIGEDLEGKLISVSGRIFETSGKTFWINDGFSDIKIYIKDSTGIKIARKKVGDYVKIIGILSQWGFDDDEKPNYRLLPRFQSDVLISSAPIGGVSQVLGAVALPKTGVSLSELPGVIWQGIILRNLSKGLTFLSESFTRPRLPKARP